MEPSLLKDAEVYRTKAGKSSDVCNQTGPHYTDHPARRAGINFSKIYQLGWNAYHGIVHQAVHSVKVNLYCTGMNVSTEK